MRRKTPFFRTSMFCALAACLLLAGCKDELDDAYGQRAGLGAGKSVNGAGVLGKMFERAGHRVLSAGRLSPRLAERADCIVWFPDDFRPPSDEVRGWLETWLDAKPGRTLIYVGRDFDAARWYWEKIGPSVPPDQRDAHRQRLEIARTQFAVQHAGLPRKERSPWFNVERKLPRRPVRTLSGDAEWLAGVDPAKLEIELNGRFRPAADARVLLDSGGDMLVSRQPLGQGQLIVVTNGSFLLNLPLVNHEHRKLAAKLIDAVVADERTVVFLESRAGGPPIASDDPAHGMSTGMEIFNVWPTNWILLHLAVVGILFCFWRFPIFGLARPAEAEPLSDFGKHLDAVGELLRQSGDENYARERVKQYLQKVKPSVEP